MEDIQTLEEQIHDFAKNHRTYFMNLRKKKIKNISTTEPEVTDSQWFRSVILLKAGTNINERTFGRNIEEVVKKEENDPRSTLAPSTGFPPTRASWRHRR